MRIRKFSAIIIWICGFSLSVLAAVGSDSNFWAPPLDVQGTKIVNARGYALQLKGFATMDPTTVTEDQIIHFKNDWNITVLRLPLLTGSGRCWVVDSISVNASNAPYLAAADSVLKWCEENHIYVLLDGWHEGGTGNTVGDFSSTVAAWSILSSRYQNQDHILWEIFNEPHDVSWTAWVPMAEQLIDTIRTKNPISQVIVAGTVSWCQIADVDTLKINRDKVVYSWHPYEWSYGGGNDSIGDSVWDRHFGYIMTTGIAPVMATEWGFTSQQDSAVYGTEIIQYFKSRGISWTGWIYSDSWWPPMLVSMVPELRNPSGNLMYNAYHDTTSVVSAVKQPVGKSTPGHNIVITNSAIQFYCAETSPVTLSIYALNGHCVGKLIDQTLRQGSHSIRWNAKYGDGSGIAPGLYTVRLKIKDREYYGQLNNLK